MIGGSRHEVYNHSIIPDRSRTVKKSQATAEEYSIHEYELSNHLNSCFNSNAPVCIFQTGAFLLLSRGIVLRCPLCYPPVQIWVLRNLNRGRGAAPEYDAATKQQKCTCLKDADRCIGIKTAQETAEQDAHQIEHAISDLSFQKLKEKAQQID